jgi:hypothetical protein
VGRALLVGALLVSGYALVRYWRSLAGRSRQVKFSLVGLRAMALLLVSCALAGFEVEYDSTARARVSLSSSRGVGEASSTGGGVSRIAEQLTAALEKRGFEVALLDDESGAGGDAGGVVAVAFLTDGAMRAVDARQKVEQASVRAGGAPVYVVADLGEGKGASVSLESVTATGRAVRGVPVTVRCEVHARGMQGRESLLTISDEAKVQVGARLKWASDDERQAVTLQVVPKVAGWVDYTAKVEAAGGEDAQTTLTRPFTLYVEERRLRVLFFEGEPTWEAKFIRRALEGSGLFDVDYFAQVSRAATAGVSEDTEAQEPGAKDNAGSSAGKNLKSAGTPEAKLHATLSAAASLNAYDCVIVGATPNDLLSSSEVARLNAWVERRGGGLVVLGGNSFSGAIAAPGGKLYSLLPAETSAQSFGAQSQTASQGRPLEAEKTEANVPLTPTEAGAGGALVGYSAASEEAGAKRTMLTGQGFRLGALRPGASVLAVAGQPGANGTSETGAPLIAAMRYGAGRTLLFGPADSWRIRTSAGGEEDRAGGPFSALWQGIVLWTSEGARAPVLIALSDESPSEGSTLTAEIRVRDASFAPLKIEKLNTRLQPLTENTDAAAQPPTEAREIAFAPDDGDASVWRAEIPLRERGRFSLEADFIAGGTTGTVEKRFAVVAALTQEAGAAFDTLRRVARATGGELISSVEIDALAERLAAASSSKETVRRTWEMRSWWPLAFIVPLLLSAEWFARRWWRVD